MYQNIGKYICYKKISLVKTSGHIPFNYDVVKIYQSQNIFVRYRNISLFKLRYACIRDTAKMKDVNISANLSVVEIFPRLRLQYTFHILLYKKIW